MAKTLEELITRRFQDVTVTGDGEINTAEFLEAAEGVVKMFDLLDSAAFYPVKSDMTTNIEKVRAKSLSGPDPARYDTLQKIVRAEAQEGDRTATQGLLWLKRGLELTAMALKRSLETPAEELAESFTLAYNNTLKQFHGFIVKKMFGVAMMACPTRAVFFDKIGGNREGEREELLAWVNALQSLLNELNIFYAKGAYDKGL
ncbi:hypothetical protein H4R22_004798 [Coemansia sp. RSA 1290]|nr:hypothetical protein H4R22_004798 [Coemansia sp. RSA 1290]KAJ2652551.1 hypothetical protein IWW40_001037 [Coemansia sp. RSA 1250]